MCDMEENIVGYEGYYVTNMGEVYSTKCGYKRLLKSRKSQNGYLYVNLSKNGKYKSKNIHILVAKAYIPNPNNFPQVNHIDGNKSNNNVNNLEWCTASHNMKHAYKIGVLTLKKGEEHNSAKLKEKDIIEIRNKFETKKYTHLMLANEYGVTRGNIRHILTRRTWKEI